MIEKLHLLLGRELCCKKGLLTDDAVHIFSNLPTKRKRLQRTAKLEFSPADWMGDRYPEFCPA
jgi:hypothetical protein